VQLLRELLSKLRGSVTRPPTVHHLRFDLLLLIQLVFIIVVIIVIIIIVVFFVRAELELLREGRTKK
jgi:hypothetical protein